MIALSRAVALRRHPRARWGHLSCRLFFSQLAAGSQKLRAHIRPPYVRYLLAHGQTDTIARVLGSVRTCALFTSRRVDDQSAQEGSGQGSGEQSDGCLAGGAGTGKQTQGNVIAAARRMAKRLGRRVGKKRGGLKFRVVSRRQISPAVTPFRRGAQILVP